MFIYIFLNELGSDNDRIDSCIVYKLGNWYAPKFISRHCIVSEKPKDKPKKEEPVYDKNCKDYLPAAVCAIQNCKKNNSYKKGFKILPVLLLENILSTSFWCFLSVGVLPT